MGIIVKVGLRDTLVPPGAYKAKVERIIPKEFFKRPSYEFQFEIVDGDFKGTQLRGFINGAYKSFSAHTKLYQWYVVANKDHVEPGSDMDLDDFKDKVFLVEVETKISKKTKNQFSNVTKLLEKVMELSV